MLRLWIITVELDNCAQIWGMDVPYCNDKYVCEDKIYVFTREIVR